VDNKHEDATKAAEMILQHRTWASAEIFPGWGQSRHFAYPFQYVGDATQMDVYKKCPMLRQQLRTVFSLQENFALRKFCFSENGYFTTEFTEF